LPVLPGLGFGKAFIRSQPGQKFGFVGFHQAWGIELYQFGSWVKVLNKDKLPLGESLLAPEAQLLLWLAMSL